MASLTKFILLEVVGAMWAVKFLSFSGTYGTHTAEVKNTRNVPLLQTKRKDIKAYRFDLSDGEYEVELLFADLNAPSERVTYDLGGTAVLSNADFRGSVFNVSVNGRLWLNHFLQRWK